MDSTTALLNAKLNAVLVTQQLCIAHLEAISIKLLDESESRDLLKKTHYAAQGLKEITDEIINIERRQEIDQNKF